MTTVGDALTEYLPQVRAIAQRLRRRLPPNVEFDDLVQSGCVGLIHSARRFDPAAGASFMTFAAPRVLGAMLDALRDDDPLGRADRAMQHRVLQADAELRAALGRPPTEAELAARIGRSAAEHRAHQARIDAARAASAVDDEDAADAPQAEAADETADPSRRADARLQLQRLAELLPMLPARERELLEQLYDDGLQMTEVARQLGISVSAVSQRHRQAIRRLRCWMDRPPLASVRSLALLS